MAATSATTVSYSLQADGAGMAQTIRQNGTSHVLKVDTVPAFGGKDESPGPLPYALAALTSCSNITAQVVARELGIVLKHLRFDVESQIDLALLMGQPAPARPDFQSIDLKVTVQADASPEQIQRLQAETERRCPVFQLFTRSGVPIRSQWTQHQLNPGRATADAA